MFSFEIESGKAECYGTVVPSLPMCVRVCVYGMYTAHFLAPHSFPVYVCVIRQRGRGCVGDKEELSWTLDFTYDEASGLLDVSPEYNTIKSYPICDSPVSLLLLGKWCKRDRDR